MVLALFRAANGAVFALADKEKSLRPATTLVAALIVAEEFWIGNVGDSRAYLFRKGLEQLTEDHVLRGPRTSPPEFPTAASRNRSGTLTRALGLQSEIAVDVHGPFRLLPGDRILLCSDGLYSALTKSDLARAIGGKPLSAAIAAVTRLAVKAGSRDDISAVLLGPADT